MFRTGLVLLLAATLVAGSCGTALAQEKVSRIDGIGLLDYASGPAEFKVGAWARYHIGARSQLGVVDDYTVTVLIAGEEHWWGEDCFWVETWTDVAGQPPATAATLMSYAVFDDSLPFQHMQLFMRKTITGMRDDGRPDQQIYRRPVASLKQRDPIGSKIAWNVDTLGTETITTARGPMTARKVKIEQGVGATSQSADSSQYTELRETRLTYLTPTVPLTHIAREEIDTGYTRRTWAIGHSKEGGPTNVLDQSHGVAELVDFGTGETARLVPPEVRKAITREGDAAARRAAARRRG
jgi:hypothetical protein